MLKNLKTGILKNNAPEKGGILEKNRQYREKGITQEKVLAPPGACSRLATEKSLLLWARNRPESARIPDLSLRCRIA